MRAWNSSLTTALAGAEVRRCMLAELVSRSNVTVRLTSHDVDIVAGGQTFQKTPGFTCSRLTVSHGGTPATLDLQIPFSDDGPIYTDHVRRGAWRGAVITVWLTLTDNPSAREILGKGFIGLTGFTDRLDGRIELLTLADALKDIVLFTIQPKCQYKLYGARCGVDETTNRFAATVATAASRRRFTASVMPAAGHTFKLGKVTWTTGDNSGWEGWIRNWDAGSHQFDMVTDFPFDIAVGHQFWASHGCAQTRAACISFDNVDRFPGFEFVSR
jgi:uncharacterized phage protein (TIGR02218 family)